MSNNSKVQEIIEYSGNTFHAKVARWFDENGWEVQISPYFLDQSLQKAREIDLIVEKKFCETNISGIYTGDIVLKLFIECKYANSDSVFWFADKDYVQAKKLVCRSGPFRDNNSNTDDHHYLSHGSKVAKLFASTKGKNHENEPIYRALNQVLNGLISMRRMGINSLSIKNQLRRKITILEFPVIVCSSFEKLFMVNFFEDSEAKRIDEIFQMEVEYAFVNKNQSEIKEYFLIDFVEFDKLTFFEELLLKDAETAAFFASNSSDQINF